MAELVGSYLVSVRRRAFDEIGEPDASRDRCVVLELVARKLEDARLNQARKESLAVASLVVVADGHAGRRWVETNTDSPSTSRQQIRERLDAGAHPVDADSMTSGHFNMIAVDGAFRPRSYSPVVADGFPAVKPDTSGWETWQLEYQFGAFYVFAPEAVTEMVDELRRVNDPRSHAICQAHISLSEPLPRPPTDLDLAELRGALSTVDPFIIRYGPVVSFSPYPGVAFAIEPQARFRDLRVAVHGAPGPLSQQ